MSMHNISAELKFRGSRISRSQRGMAVAALMALVAVLIIAPLVLFVYELGRFSLCKQQLKSCVDLAALTAACSTTASNSSDTKTTETAAMDEATWMFNQNFILDQSLAGTAYTYGTSPPTFAPAINKAQLYFEFLDPVTKSAVPFGDERGKIMRVYGSFGFTPDCAHHFGLGVGPYIATEVSDGGLPMIDVVLCFDISGSMDDFTNVSLVNRYNKSGVNAYSLPKITTTTYGAPGPTFTEPTVQGPLYYAMGATYELGSANNAGYPMDINSGGGSGNVQGIYYFNSAGHGTHNNTVAPQGKATLDAWPSGWAGYSFTDCVVNVDGTKDQSKGITINGFDFPKDDTTNHYGLGVLVEASRGNLENTTVASAAGVPYTAMGITPKPGYFQAYYQATHSAMAGFPDTSVTVPLRHPIGDAITAAQSFFGILSNDADSHFGLVTFSTNAGTQETAGDTTHSGQPYYMGNFSAYTGSGPTTGSYPTEPVKPPNPAIYLDPTPGAAYSRYDSASPPANDSVNGALFGLTGGASTYSIHTVVAEGGTNVQDSLDRALAMLLGTKKTDPSVTPLGRPALKLARPGTIRAIVLFTDGLPNGGGDSGVSDPNSQKEAKFANSAGIPIYTIGLCLTKPLQAKQVTVLTDDGTKSSTGIAYLSGNGATFVQATTAAELNGVFQNVARQLVQLVK